MAPRLLITSIAIAGMLIGNPVTARIDDISIPDDNPLVLKDVDPDNLDHLNGVWSCYFVRSTNPDESGYFSIWKFNAAQGRLEVHWSPVHKFEVSDYTWDGYRLETTIPGTDQERRTYTTQVQVGGAFVVQMPELPFKGWYCHRVDSLPPQPNPLRYLDYSRYPWLSQFATDWANIEKYENQLKLK